MTNSTIMTVRELIKLAFGDKDKNTINFKHVETVLYLMARQLSVLQRNVEVTIDPQLISDLTRKPSILSVTEVNIHAALPEVLEPELPIQTSPGNSMTLVKTPTVEKGHFSHDHVVQPHSKSSPIPSVISDKDDGASKGPRVSYGGVHSKEISPTDSDYDRDKKPFKLEIKKPTPKVQQEKYLVVHRRESEDKFDVDDDQEPTLSEPKSAIGSPEDKYKTVSVVTKDQYKELLNEIVQLNKAANKEANMMPESKLLMEELHHSASITHPMTAIVLSDRLEQSEKKLGDMVSVLETFMKHLNAPNLGKEPVSAIQSAPSHKSSHDKNITVSHVSLMRRTSKRSSNSSKQNSFQWKKEQYSSADFWSDSFRTEESSTQMALGQNYFGYNGKDRQESETQIKHCHETDSENYKMPDIILEPLDTSDDENFDTKPTKCSYGTDTSIGQIAETESCMQMYKGTLVCVREKCKSHCEEQRQSERSLSDNGISPCHMTDNLKLTNSSLHDSRPKLIPFKHISNGSSKYDQSTLQSQGGEKVMVFDENSKPLTQTLKSASDISINHKNCKRIRWSEMPDADDVYDKHDNLLARVLDEYGKPISWSNAKNIYTSNKENGELTLPSKKSEHDKDYDVKDKSQSTSRSQRVEEVMIFDENSKLCTLSPKNTSDVSINNKNGKRIHWSELAEADDDLNEDAKPFSPADEYDSVYNNNDQTISQSEEIECKLVPQASNTDDKTNLYNINGKLIQISQIDLANQVYDKYGNLMPPIYDENGEPIRWSVIDKTDKIYNKNGNQVSHVYTKGGELIPLSQEAEFIKVHNENGDLIQRLHDKDGKLIPFSRLQDDSKFHDENQNDALPPLRDDQKENLYDIDGNPILWSQVNDFDQVYTKEGQLVPRVYDSNVKPIQWSQMDDMRLVYDKKGKLIQRVYDKNGKQIPWSLIKVPEYKETPSKSDFMFKKSEQGEQIFMTNKQLSIRFTGPKALSEQTITTTRKTPFNPKHFTVSDSPKTQAKQTSNTPPPIKALKNKHSAATNKSLPRKDKTGGIKGAAKQKYPSLDLYDTALSDFADFGIEIMHDNILEFDKKPNNYDEVYDKNGIPILRTQVDNYDEVYDKHGNIIPRVYDESGKPIPWSKIDDTDVVYRKDREPISRNDDKLLQDNIMVFDKNGMPIPRSQMDKYDTIYDKSGNPIPQVYNQNGKKISWSDIDNIDNVYDEHGKLIPHAYNQDDKLISLPQLSNDPIGFEKFGKEYKSTMCYDKDGYPMPWLKVDDTNDVYDKNGKLIPRVYDNDGNPIPWSKIGDADEVDDKNGTQIPRVYDKGNRISGVSDKHGSSTPLSRIDEANENREKRPVETQSINKSKPITKNKFYDTYGNPARTSQVDDHPEIYDKHGKVIPGYYDSTGEPIPVSKSEEHDRIYDKNGKDTDYLDNKRKSQVYNLGSRQSWHVSSSTFGDLASRSYSGQKQSFTAPDLKIIDWALQNELEQGIQMLQDEFRKNMYLSFERPSKDAQQSVQRLTKMHEQLQSTLGAENRMPALDSDIAKFSQRISAMELGMVLEMTRYQDEITQQQLRLEMAIEAMADAIANVAGDPQAIEELNGELLSMKNNIDSLSLGQRDLQDLLNNFKLDLKELRIQVQRVTSTKADRKEVAQAMEGKANIADLNQVVSNEEFAAVMEVMVKLIAVAYDKFNHQERSWQVAIDEFVNKCVNEKAGIDSVTSLAEDIMRHIEHLREKKDYLLSIVGEPDLIHSCRQIERDTCLCCDTAVVEPPEPNKFAADKSKAKGSRKTEANTNKLEKVNGDRILCYPGLPATHDMDPRSVFCNRYCRPTQNTSVRPRDAAPASIPKELIVKPLLQTGLTKALKAGEDRKACLPCNRQSTGSQVQPVSEGCAATPSVAAVITLDLN